MRAPPVHVLHALRGCSRVFTEIIYTDPPLYRGLTSADTNTNIMLLFSNYEHENNDNNNKNNNNQLHTVFTRTHPQPVDGGSSNTAVAKGNTTRERRLSACLGKEGAESADRGVLNGETTINGWTCFREDDGCV